MPSRSAHSAEDEFGSKMKMEIALILSSWALHVSFRGPLVTPRGLQGHALSTVTVPTHSGHSHFSRHCSSESVWLEPKRSAA